jgi:hypothetical protein
MTVTSLELTAEIVLSVIFCGLFNDHLSVAGWFVNDEVERILKETVVA